MAKAAPKRAAFLLMPIAIKASMLALFPVGEKLCFPGIAQAILPLEPCCVGILILQAQEGQVM